MTSDSHYKQGYLLKNSACIFLHNAVIDGKIPFFFYLAVKGIELEHYRKILMNPDATLQDYEECGVILKAGFGEPSDSDKQFMEQEYGYRSDAPNVPIRLADQKLNAASSGDIS